MAFTCCCSDKNRRNSSPLPERRLLFELLSDEFRGGASVHSHASGNDSLYSHLTLLVEWQIVMPSLFSLISLKKQSAGTTNGIVGV